MGAWLFGAVLLAGGLTGVAIGWRLGEATTAMVSLLAMCLGGWIFRTGCRRRKPAKAPTS